MRSVKLFFIFFVFLITYFLIKNFFSSIFIKGKDRVNVVFYSQTPKFFSFSKSDVNYLIKFSSDKNVLVPGGYNNYRVGGLRKLIDLDKKPHLIQKTFSAATFSLVDLYFYPKKTEIYYGDLDKNNFPSVFEILINSSNANFIDRLFLFFKFFKKNEADYKIVYPDEIIQGFFYKRDYREIGENIQILYKKSYLTAELLAKILEGEGIRVVDLTKKDLKIKNCQLIVRKKSKISQELASYFNCQLKIGETEVSDIIFILGNLEDSWAVK